MNNIVKDVHKKTTRTTFWWYVNIKDFDPNNIKTDEKSYENILINYILYVTIKDSKYVKISSENSLYLMFNKINGYLKKLMKISI